MTAKNNSSKSPSRPKKGQQKPPAKRGARKSTRKPASDVLEENEFGLSHQEQLFAEHYLRTFNRTKAATAAGFSPNSAHVTGCRLLKRDNIQAYVRARMQEAAMTTNELLYHLANIARGDLDDLIDRYGALDIDKARELGVTNLIRRVRTKTTITTDADNRDVEVHETETEGYDRLRAIELLGKSLGMWKERVQVETWEDKAIEGIRSGTITYADLAEGFDEPTAQQLFLRAGKEYVTSS